MANLLQIRTNANKRLSDHFSRDRNCDYDRVFVLLIYWEESDMPQCKDESEQLGTLFRSVFNYQDIDYFAISQIDSDLDVDKRLYEFVEQLKTHKNSLEIIHYGGHGDEVEREGRLSEWASHSSGGSTLRWSELQPKLRHANSPILLILDCCYAAQAARLSGGERIVPPNVELLAACGMGCQIPPPMTDNSFTIAFIRELEAALLQREIEGPVTMAEIHVRLASRAADLTQTPIRFPLKGELQ